MSDLPATMPASDWQDPEYWPGDLKAALEHLPRGGAWHLALSGGLDSVFLLHCLTAIATAEGRSLNAIHINHGLQPEALEWENQCQALCHTLGVSFQNHHLDLAPDIPDLEARARQARYEVFEQALQPTDTLFMAHHGDDQAETVLLRLLRGSGVRGLAGMPASRNLGPGYLHRPLLPLTRARLEVLARDWGLTWCEDHSNNNTRFDRNYLRHEVMPAIRARWPEAVSRFTRSADHCREADKLLDELARQDAEAVSAGEGVSLARIHELTNPRRQQLIRYLLRLNGLQPPGEKRLQTGLDALLTAPPDGAPELRGEDYRLCRFRNQLWIVPELPDVDPSVSAPWHPDEPMDWFGTTLFAHRNRGVGIAVSEPNKLAVAPRQGGERIQAGPEQPERPLKKWLQEQLIPPWERQRLPLIWYRDELVAIADYWISPSYRAHSNEQGWRPVWHRPWRLLRGS